MEFIPLSIPEVILIKPRIVKDLRGFFMETYKRSLYKANGIDIDFVQDNYSYSMRNTLRGLHYQTEPAAQGKLVRCSLGKILDVAVDIRPGSQTFGKWASAVIDDESCNMIYIPPGFAHGFLVVSRSAHVHYKTTAEYDPACDRGIRWDDPYIGITWPVESPILSDKDRDLPYLGHIAG